jgi:hypothetical protein
MRIYRPILILLFIIAIACLSGVQGQSETSSSIVTPNEASQYTQYYAIPAVSAPSTHISIPVQINVLGKTLTSRYLGTQLQAVPYSQYQSNGNITGVNSLWIQETPSWTQYIEVPQGAKVTLIAVSPADGSGYLSEIQNGTAYNSNFFFYRNSQLTFYADTIGQHVLSFTINGQPSNQVTINVIAYVPPQCYPTPYNYYAPYDYLTPKYYRQSYYYPGHHYPGYTSSGLHWSPFYGGRKWYDSDYPWLNAP